MRAQTDNQSPPPRKEEEMIRPAWFVRSLPRDFGYGRIQVEGDGAFQQEAIRVARWMAGAIILVVIAWAVWR